MFDDEAPQEIFNRLKKMVNKVKALGSKRYTDRMLIESLMRAYTPMNYNVVALIRQDPTYKKMRSDDILGRIINHEMYIEEANHIKNLYKGVTTTKKHEIALKVSYPVFVPKQSTHRMYDPGSIVPHIRPKVFTDNQMSRIKYNYYISNISKNYDDSQRNGTTEDSITPQEQQPRQHVT
jgi:hypothetical protein